MPTQDPHRALDRNEAREVVAHALAPPRHSGDGLGMEIELLAIGASSTGPRVPLEGNGLSVRGILEPHVQLGQQDGGPVGTTVTAEPGGQVEVATTCFDLPDDVVSQADRATSEVAGWFARDDAILVAAGMDLWHDVADVPQQLRDARYPAMAAYFDRRGPAGAIMMRHTCALQLSLDLGRTADEVEERWRVANLLAPLATASFANSPSVDGQVRSTRSRTWQRVDPTRTGFPAGLLDGNADMPGQVLQAALEADVLLVRTGSDDTGYVTGAVPGRPGWRFVDWLVRGDPALGWPDADDLRYHLTTLFHEVRARGNIEVRSIDALPQRWRSVPVVLYAGALFDPVARSRIHEVLAPHRTDLPRLLRQAAATGLSDPSLCALAVEAWSFALAGARRLPGVDTSLVATVEDFIDRFTVRGRCPADELAEAFERSPAAAMELLTEPAPAAAGTRR